MTAGGYWQLVGAIFELGGLTTVAIGIATHRQKYTKNPNWLIRMGRRLDATFGSALEWAWRKFDREQTPTIFLPGVALTATSGMSPRLTRVIGLNGTVEKQLAKVQTVLQEHEEAIDSLKIAISDEAEERKKREAELRKELQNAVDELNLRISEVAAGSLRLETFGVVAFAIGIGFTMIGLIVG